MQLQRDKVGLQQIANPPSAPTSCPALLCEPPFPGAECSLHRGRVWQNEAAPSKATMPVTRLDRSKRCTRHGWFPKMQLHQRFLILRAGVGMLLQQPIIRGLCMGWDGGDEANIVSEGWAGIIYPPLMPLYIHRPQKCLADHKGYGSDNRH